MDTWQEASFQWKLHNESIQVTSLAKQKQNEEKVRWIYLNPSNEHSHSHQHLIYEVFNQKGKIGDLDIFELLNAEGGKGKPLHMIYSLSI